MGEFLAFVLLACGIMFLAVTDKVPVAHRFLDAPLTGSPAAYGRDVLAIVAAIWVSRKLFHSHR